MGLSRFFKLRLHFHTTFDSHASFDSSYSFTRFCSFGDNDYMRFWDWDDYDTTTTHHHRGTGVFFSGKGKL